MTFRRCSCCRGEAWHKRVKRKIAACFWSYGALVARRPVVFIALPIVLCGALGVGLVRLTVEKDVETLFMPRGTRAIADRARLQQIFPNLNNRTYSAYSQNTWQDFFVVLLEVKDPRGSIFSDEVVAEAWRLLRRGLANLNNNTVTWQQVCARYQNDCVISGLQYASPDFVRRVRARQVTYPILRLTDEHEVDLSMALAGVVTDPPGGKGILVSARVLKVTFVLYKDTDWSRRAVDYAKTVKLKLLRMTFEGTHSLSDELFYATKGDVWLFVLTLALCLAYATLSTMGGDAVSTRTLLAFVGVLAAGLGILASVGLLSLCGLRFANIVGITPYLVIGIGVDDMFLLMSSWSETLNEFSLTVNQRVSTTMAFAGLGITITSLTDFLAFLIGGTSIFFSVQVFCIYTGLAVLFVYLCHVTLFVACLSLHGRRVYSGRHCLTCLPAQSRHGLRQQGRCLPYRLLCGGQIPRKARDDESVFEMLPRQLLPRIILHRSLRYLILAAFAALIAVSCYGVFNVKQGLDFADLVKVDSYYRAHSLQSEKYFPVTVPVAFVVDGEVDYLGEDGRKLKQLVAAAQRDRDIRGDRDHCWLTHYERTMGYRGTDASQFFLGLARFLRAHPIYVPDIVFGGNASSPRITASRCCVISLPTPDKYQRAELMLRMRELADRSTLGVPVIAYHWSFLTYEGLLQTLPNTIFTLSVAVAAMVVVCLIFIPHPFMVALVTFNILMIIANIFAFMYFWGLTLSIITMIHLIMSIGFSVDFSVHVCTAYLMSNSRLRQDRAYDAVTHAASPIFNGGMSSFVGVILLLFSDSYIFLTFFKVMLLVILFGMLNAILFVPTVLSLIGPENRPGVAVFPLGSLTLTPNTRTASANDSGLGPVQATGDSITIPTLVVHSVQSQTTVHSRVISREDKDVRSERNRPPNSNESRSTSSSPAFLSKSSKISGWCQSSDKELKQPDDLCV